VNDHPDAFEWRLLKNSFLGLGILLTVVYALSLITLALPLETRYPHAGIVASLYSFGFVLMAVSVWWVRALPANSPALFPLSLASVLATFLVSVGVLAFSGGNQSISVGAFLAISSFYLFILGFFSKDQRVTVAFGALLVATALALFVVWPREIFPQVVSVAEIEKNLTGIALFTVPMVTAMVVLNNRVSATLTGKAREAVARLGHLAYFDVETDLPNGLLLEKDMGDWAAAGQDLTQRLALVGFRLEGLDSLNEARGLEFTTKTVQRLVKTFHRGLESGLDAVPESRAPSPLRSLYRIEGSTFFLPLTIPAGTRPDRGPLEGLLDRVLQEENSRLSQGQPLGYQGGFTVFPDDSPSSHQLVRNLLHLLHSAKVPGPDGFQPFNPVRYQEYLRREKVKEALALAVPTPEISVVFQPKLRLADGSLSGFEALARWSSPGFGEVGPAEFIPLAEEYGLIGPLTLKIFEHTVGLVSRLLESGIRDFRVSINLSPELLTPVFLEGLAAKCEANGLSNYLELEITEGILMVLAPGIVDYLRRLRTLGVRFSIDDFGTGYSNLAYLQSFEAEVLKIDKRFIDGIPKDEKNAKLVLAILQMAQSFGMKVVAEGVEYAEQRDYLAAIGCHQIQGYFYSKPLPLEEALAYARASNPG